MKYLCETKELAIGYGSAPLASDITLGAVPGQILALIGPNGAGKSTLLKTLAGQLAPLGGAVLLDGRSLTAYTGPARARISTASATASASAFCWPVPSASSPEFCCWTSRPLFWMSRARSSC